MVWGKVYGGCLARSVSVAISQLRVVNSAHKRDEVRRNDHWPTTPMADLAVAGR